jgi:hypothetical protein
MSANASFANTLAKLYVREGYPFLEDGVAVHAAHIRWELDSGQWVMLTSPDKKLWGWMSWYRMDEATLKVFETGEIEDRIREQLPMELQQGEHLYIATTVVAPWAPDGTYRRLFDLVQIANSGAKTISAHLRKRNGTVRWMHRVLH